MAPRSDRLALVSALLSTRWTRTGNLPHSALPSGVKRDANEIASSPLQPAKAHSLKIVEWNAELGGHNVEPGQSNAGSVVCHIADAASVDAGLAGKKHERAAIDDGSTFRAALKKVVFLRACGIWRRHDARFECAKQSRQAEYDTWWLCHAGSGRGEIVRLMGAYALCAKPQRNSFVKLNAGAAG
jgi:hypothetical protein